MILFLILIAEYPVTIKTMITFLLTNDKLKLPMHLRQPDFGPIAKTTEKVKKFKKLVIVHLYVETGSTNHVFSINLVMLIKIFKKENMMITF